MYFVFVFKCFLQQVFVFCILNTFVPRNGYVNNAERRKFPTVKAYFVNNSLITSKYVLSCAITHVQTGLQNACITVQIAKPAKI